MAVTYQDALAGGISSENSSKPGNFKIPSISQLTQAVTKPKSDYEQFVQGGWKNWTLPAEQVQSAFKQMMPMYQSRLSGLQGPVAEAMRNRGLETIQNQYGSALRSAMNQAAAQGVRGPAAVAMQQDIRDQMGRATAGYQRDLTIADWDAKRQALADYYGFAGGERGVGVGTPLAIQQLANTQAGFGQYNNALSGMQNANQSGGGGFINTILNPQTMVGLPRIIPVG